MIRNAVLAELNVPSWRVKDEAYTSVAAVVDPIPRYLASIRHNHLTTCNAAANLPLGVGFLASSAEVSSPDERPQLFGQLGPDIFTALAAGDFREVLRTLERRAIVRLGDLDSEAQDMDLDIRALVTSVVGDDFVASLEQLLSRPVASTADGEDRTEAGGEA